MSVTIRDECERDHQAVHRLLIEAFGRRDEANLVETLRKSGELVISLLAEDDAGLAGYVGLSRLKSPNRALALAPVAVAPKHRRRGLGARLVREGLERARLAGNEIVFVLGAPDYYGRFDFTREATRDFDCIYAGPFFLGLWLTDVRRKPGPVIYPDVFDGLD